MPYRMSDGELRELLRVTASNRADEHLYELAAGVPFAEVARRDAEALANTRQRWFTRRDMEWAFVKGIGVGVLVGMVLGTAVCSILLAIKLG